MNDPVSSLIIRQMDYAAARQRVLAHNLANFGTPGAVPKGASFEAALDTAKAGAGAPAGTGAAGQAPSAARADAADAAKDALQGLAPDGEEAGGASISAPDTAEGLEMQMARMADNTGRFSALARILTIRERAYENAIRGR